MNKKLKFKMPDGSILTRQYDVDDYHKLAKGTTGQRIYRGWTIEEYIRGIELEYPISLRCQMVIF